MARVDHFCELRARARRSRARRRPIFFLRIRLAAPSAASYGVDVAAGGLHRQADGSRPCARSEISAVPFIRWRYGAERRAGLLFGLGLGRGRRATGQDRRRPLAPGGSRAPKIASALNLHPKGPALITFVNYARARGGAEPAAGRFSFCESGWRRRAQRATGSTSPPAACTGKLMARVDHFCELRARARRSRARRRPIFFLRIRLAAPSAASYGVDVAAGGLHRQADGSRPCARSEISAVPFIRWRYGAERRAGLLFGLGLGRGRRATGQDRRRPLAPGGSRAPKIASALNLHPKGPALITFVNYARARGGAEPAAGRFSFCESGWRRRAQRATGSTSPPAACTGKLMARVDHFCELRARARRSRARRRPIFFLRIRLAAPSAASYGVDVAAGGLHRQADGPR